MNSEAINQDSIETFLSFQPFQHIHRGNRKLSIRGMRAIIPEIVNQRSLQGLEELSGGKVSPITPHSKDLDSSAANSKREGG